MPNIKMYCTENCEDCAQARAYFAARKIPYQEIDLDEHPEAWALVEKITGGPHATPTFDIDGTYVVEFDLAALEEVLGISL